MTAPRYELILGTGPIKTGDHLEQLIKVGIQEWKSRVYANRPDQGPDIRVWDNQENRFMQIGSARLIDRESMRWEQSE